MGVLGAFGRLTSQQFASRLPKNVNTPPFTVSKDIRDGRWYYEMPASVADVIEGIERSAKMLVPHRMQLNNTPITTTGAVVYKTCASSREVKALRDSPHR